MSDIDVSAAETPLIDLMARIPKDAALGWHEQHGLGAYCHAPVGAYVHRAMMEIERLRADKAERNAEVLRLHVLETAARAEIDRLIEAERKIVEDIAEQRETIERLRSENATLTAMVAEVRSMPGLVRKDAEITRLRADNAALRTAFAIAEDQEAHSLSLVDGLEEENATLRAHVEKGKVLAANLDHAISDLHTTEITRLRSDNAKLREAIDNLQVQACDDVVPYWVAVPKVEWDSIMATLRGEKP